MEEAIRSSKEEMKRVDHLIFVSLKYTRTCDIFKSIIERLINAIDFSLMALLKKLEQEQKIVEIPAQPLLKTELVKEHYDDDTVKKLIDFYLLLRRINKEKFTRAREFRRHVTMTVQLAEGPFDVNIDLVTEYYKDTKEMFGKIYPIVIGEPEEN
ncbi:hypothetical protein ACFL0W_04195 [Nanoarchaeota archaeon]